ncbi:MAG: Xaa-Pro aminopeptidase [Clostridia bacterium]|jgi:Xaa-Pro aminopeptidase|nr:Xaa-Pro aminopeptidase [Clostridia bacterium]
MYKEKLEQAGKILKEQNIDIWLTLVRETIMNNDPILPFISKVDFTALSGIMVMKSGKTVVLAGNNDAEGIKQTQLYDDVITYSGNFKEALSEQLDLNKVTSLAVNYSIEDVASDGLSHGLFLLLQDVVNSTNSKPEIVSAAPIISKLRGNKTTTEKQLIIEAINTAEVIFQDARHYIKEGVTEQKIHQFFTDRMKHYDVKPSWQASQCPGVMLGPKSVPGHNSPTEITACKGDVMDIDFGVLQNGYCSDLQRTYYVLQDNENCACEEVQKAFDTLKEAVRRAAEYMKPGVTGEEADAVARDYVMSQGYQSWNYALGHQVGRMAHDGGMILAPKWNRYSSRQVELPMEAGMVFTLEPGIATSRGYVGIEEMVYITDEGAEFLSSPQQEIYLLK